MAEKRKRGQNFSVEDKDKLIKLLLQHKDTILNKKTDGSTNEAKNSAWMSITNSFNSTSNTHRNKESLVKMWEKLKSDSKKYYAQVKNNTTQTGGGPSILKIDPVLEQVCAILGRGCTGILGIPDSDAATVQDTEQEYKVFCTQDEFWQPAVLPQVAKTSTLRVLTQTIAEPQNLEAQEDIPEQTQYSINEYVIDDLAEEPEAIPSGSEQKRTRLNTQDTIQKTKTNKTPLWSRRRPQNSKTNERTEATSAVSNTIQNLYKKRETVEDLKEMLLREELEFKRKLYELQLKAAAKEIEIKTAILEQVKGGNITFNSSK